MSAPLPALLGLAWVYDQFEARLAAAPVELKMIDRIDPANANPEHIAHRGCVVDIPSTGNSGAYRDTDYALVIDDVRVSLTYRIRPAEQRASRGEAIALEEHIRAWLTDCRWGRDLRVAYAGTPVRGPHPKSAEFYLITQQFATLRDATLGGV